MSSSSFSRLFLLSLCLLLLSFYSIVATNIVFLEPFDDQWESRWTAIKNSKYQGEWSVESHQNPPPELKDEKGLVVQHLARHSAIITKLNLDPKEKDLVVQYEVKLQNGLECGGAYMKLLTADKNLENLEKFSDSSPYTIMFGPDKCGFDNKVHFIFRHKNPLNGTIEEKHLTTPPSISNDKLSHLYTLVVHKNNSFKIFIDMKQVREGNLLEDFSPPVNPPKVIDDPTDIKPSDWIDDPQMPDPTATKPSDWDEDAPLEIPDEEAVKPSDWLEDEPEEIPDPEAKKPDDWSDEEDGTWIPPTIENPKCFEQGCGIWKRPTRPNPAYRGKWKSPLIDNPKYIGKWKPKQIPNPAFYEDLHPHNFSPIGAIGFELWTMTDKILFDNILIGHDLAEAFEYAEKTWLPKTGPEKEQQEREAALNRQPGIWTQWTEEFFSFVEKYLGATDRTIVVAVTAVLGLLPPAFFVYFCVFGAGPTKKVVETKKNKKEESTDSKQEADDKTKEKQKDDKK